MRGRYWDNPSRSGPPEFPRSFVQDKFELRDELQVTVLFPTAGDCLFPRQPTVLFLTVLFSTVLRPITGSPESPRSFVQDKFELRDELQVPQPTVLFLTVLLCPPWKKRGAESRSHLTLSTEPGTYDRVKAGFWSCRFRY